MLKALPIAGVMLAWGGALAVSQLTAGHAASQPVAVHHPGRPVLVELFQSQGCSDCPPANANLNAIAGRPGIVALSFGVTYWDYLGWKDSFATPQNTQRQWDYAHYNHRGNVATPQVWINGKNPIVGSDANQLSSAIAEASSSGPALAVTGDAIKVGASSAPAGGGEVWVAQYDPRIVNVAIRAGENGGRTLPHKNVVRRLIDLGHWTGQARSFPRPRAADGLATAAFVQAGKGGPVLSVASAS
jgi:hypothetical protein